MYLQKSNYRVFVKLTEKEIELAMNSENSTDFCEISIAELT